MSLLKNIFKSDKYLFPDLKPGERIYKVIETFIYPDLQKIGFKMNKSSLSINRKVGDFKQVIYFAKNKYNSGNEVVSFDPHFSVTSRFYVKWHKKNYGVEPINDSIYGSRAHYLPNWNHEYFNDWWYDLAIDNNKEIVKVLKSNIENNGVPYLNILSDKRSAIDFIMSKSKYYKAPMLIDFAFMLEDKMLAEKILTWFSEYANSTDNELNERILNDISIRTELINNWA